MAIGGNVEQDILKLVFNATAWANYADNAASSPQTNVAVALHTADPGAVRPRANLPTRATLGSAWLARPVDGQCRGQGPPLFRRLRPSLSRPALAALAQ